MKLETAGDPMTRLKWTHKTTEKIATELRRLGIRVGKPTVGRLLKQLKFSLRVNHKKRSHGSPATRDLQFRYIRRLRTLFARRGDPIISVDAKKRELVGQFKNPGRAWSRHPQLVNDHDFRSLAIGVAIPYVVYDTEANRGFVLSERRRTPPNSRWTPLSNGGDSRDDRAIPPRQPC